MRRYIVPIFASVAILGCSGGDSIPSGPDLGKNAPSGNAAIPAPVSDLLDDIFVQRDRQQAKKLFSDLNSAVGSGDEVETSQALDAMLQFLVEGFAAGIMKDPAGDQPLTDALSQLLDLLFEHAGMAGPNLPPGLFGGQDVVIAVVGPAGDTVVTPSGYAGVGIPDQSIDETIIVAIQRINKDPCLPTDLPQYPGCFQFDRYPAGNFLDDITLGQCVDLRSIDFPQDTLPLLHKYEPEAPQLGVRALAPTTAEFLDCTDFFDTLFGSTGESSGLLSYASAGLKLIKEGIENLLSPTPLAASAFAIGPKRLGGLSSSFTDVGAALPAIMDELEGSGQTAEPGTAVAIPPAVVVTDANGDPVEGATVRFEVAAGGGSVTPATVITGADGVARVTEWVVGTGNNELRAWARGIAGSAESGPFIPAPGESDLVIGVGEVIFTAEGAALAGFGYGEDGYYFGTQSFHDHSLPSGFGTVAFDPASAGMVPAMAPFGRDHNQVAPEFFRPDLLECALNAPGTIATTWPQISTGLVHRSFDATGQDDMRLAIAFDLVSMRVLLNGVDISFAVTADGIHTAVPDTAVTDGLEHYSLINTVLNRLRHEGCAFRDDIVLDIPASLLNSGENVIGIIAQGYSMPYLDVRVYR